MMKKHMRRCRADGGSAMGLSQGRPNGVISGNRRRMPSQELSLGGSQAMRGGLNSRDMALGRTMGRMRGASLARELANGAALGVRRLSRGGSATTFGSRDNQERLMKARKRNEILGEPAFAKGGIVHKRMKALYEALHGHFENEPYMKKLGVKYKDVCEGEPHRARRASGGRLWIQGAIKHPGALHKSLHVPKGKKIPISKLEKAEHSKNPLLRTRAHLAATLRKFHH